MVELVYLWVEDYKNIQKQGFNFSPRFNCAYDDVKKELTIDKNDDYIPDFFGDNINVTAIVGKNGSGKSSLIDIILDSVEDTLDTKYIIVFQDSSKNLNYLSNFPIKTEINKNNNWKSRQSLFVYNNRNHKHYAFRYYNIVEIDKKSIANILSVEYGKPSTLFKISTFMYLPIFIEINLRNKEDLFNSHMNLIIGNDKKKEKIKNLFENSISDYYHQLLFIEYIKKGRNSTSVLSNIKKLKKALPNIINEKDFNQYFLPLINTKKLTISNLLPDEKKYYISRDGYFDFLDFDLIDDKERRFNNLSHGEQMIFGQLLNIYFFSNSSSDNLFFLFDEPETALHPNWQKQYLNEVITLFQKMKKEYQFIFTSHSPFLLSDLPKENVIFLDTYDEEKSSKKYPNLNIKNLENGNCINVSDHIDINPFGANIHTLLSNGFFMENGLMGEFAKNKIDEIIKNLNNKDYDPERKEKENILLVIKSIGEPFLKNKIQDMYYKKFNDVYLIEARKKELLEEQAKIETELKKYD